MNLPEERLKLAQEVLEEIKSLEDLDQLIGEISPEERAWIQSLNLDAPPTEEELEFLGPDFVERIIAYGEKHNSIDSNSEDSEPRTLEEAFMLVIADLVPDVEPNFQREFAIRLSEFAKFCVLSQDKEKIRTKSNELLAWMESHYEE